MMLIPYRMETAYTRIPYANAVLITIVSLIYFAIAFELVPEADAAEFILRDWDLSQMIGCMFLHGGFFHLLGNMIFLWVFGNVVCGTVGNIAYPFLYLFLGLCASASHLAFDGHPALGASGAINGIVGMSLILFPVNRLNCWYAFSMPLMGIMWKSGRFQIKAYWMIFAWAVFDILGVLFGGGHTAYWAHLGGFAMGLIVASCLIVFKVVETYDPTFFDILSGRPVERTQYTVDELATLHAASTGLEGVRQAVSLKQAQPVSATTASQAPPIPVLRVTTLVQKGSDLVIFFTNDGDPIRNVSLVAPDGSPAIIQPNKMIAKREMGLMRIKNLCQESLNAAELKIAYSAGPAKVINQLHYDAENRSLVVQ
jgi:membrane associated rhomboid family serine protease